VGEVTRIDPTNRRMELSIGSDDGLVTGHELYIYRTSPRPEYIGKVTIVTVEPDRAVAKVIGNTYQGKKIKEGDIVSSTIKPQF
jgi:predicted transcriptional regulator